MKTIVCLILISLFGLVTCQLHPNLNSVIKVHVEPGRAMQARVGIPSAPTETSGMTCFAVNVTGPGIDLYTDSTDLPWQCLNFTSIPPVTIGTSFLTEGADIEVLSGSTRNFEVFGIVLPSGETCDSLNIVEILKNKKSQIFRIGSAMGKEIYRDGVIIEIANEYFNDNLPEILEECSLTNLTTSMALIGKTSFTPPANIPIDSNNIGMVSAISNIDDKITISENSPPWPLASVTNNLLGVSSPRIDLIFSAESTNLQYFNKLRLNFSVVTGTVALTNGTCIVPTAANVGYNSGAKVSLWQGNNNVSQGSWSTYLTADASGTAAFSLDSVGANPLDFLFKEYNNSPSLPEAKYMHFSFVPTTTDSSSTTCNFLKIFSSSLTVVR